MPLWCHPFDRDSEYIMCNLLLSQPPTFFFIPLKLHRSYLPKGLYEHRECDVISLCVYMSSILTLSEYRHQKVADYFWHLINLISFLVSYKKISFYTEYCNLFNTNLLYIWKVILNFLPELSLIDITLFSVTFPVIILETLLFFLFNNLQEKNIKWIFRWECMAWMNLYRV